MSCLCDAEETVITDYPAKILLENLEKNVAVNVPADVTSRRPVVAGHEWGVLEDGFSAKNKGCFTKVLAAGKNIISLQYTQSSDELITSTRLLLDALAASESSTLDASFPIRRC